ncbi:hypothetical protein Tsubulata_046559 [Turnera subulata]|uniref:RBR-type E3 ubiquitin transferase n=1 Tax=Turnera subulata TaxID=218843 RepID=A0A9Q0G2Z1_9ROSI|nr:hypothetical protein Tsubulata_046559 [Turnera subulata]
MGNMMCIGSLKLRKDKKSKDVDVFVTPKSHLSPARAGDEEAIEVGEYLDSLAKENLTIFSCEICTEQVSLYDSFNVKGCSHFYCVECIIRYIKSKLEENLTCIPCPISGCEGVLEPEYCRYILPNDVFDGWGEALCESAIDVSRKFYCPYRDCSALLINEEPEGAADGICPFCNRVFCIKCKVAWHTEIDCAKFQRLEKTGVDSMLEDLASRKNWRRCPNCKFYVERIDGCLHMQCRCGYAFCYNCGAESAPDTRCPKCKGLW